MVIFKQAADLQAYLKTAPNKVAFIPTMGALHAGHTSLIRLAIERGEFTICSIFVNPTQFNDPKDFEKYPKSTDVDIQLLIEASCDVLFLPDVAEIYPDGADNIKAYDFDYLETVLEGAHRPGHFRGVGQVVGRLLEIVQPDFLYLGQKDYQQCMIIADLIRQMPGKQKPEIVTCPTVREPDGLAMSSRNRRLTAPQRALAGVIYQCLVSIQSKHNVSSFDIVQKECTELMQKKGFEPEYVSLADAATLKLMDNYDSGTEQVALIAAKLGGVRLIDNMLIS